MRFTMVFPILLLASMMFPAPSCSDWLVTLDGQLIETREPWEIDGDILTYAGLDGESHEISLGDLDLEASEETTALRAGKEFVPSKAALARRREQEREEKAGRVDEEDASIILYTRWRCGPCKEAEKYLERLGVAYAVKTEDDKLARRELRKKAGKDYILPVLDIDGEIVVGFRREDIRQLVEKREIETETTED